MRFAILILAFAAVLAGCSPAVAQAPKGAKKTEQAKPAARPEASGGEIPIGDAFALRITRLQYKQDRLLLQNKDFAIQTAKNEKEIAELRSQIEALAYDAAAAAGVDTKTHLLDLDRLVWVPRPSETKPESKSKEKQP